MSNYRPISLLPTFSKILEKVIYKRSERTLVIDEELCACFIDWQKAFDRVNWSQLMQILKGIGIDWRES
jgi:hypothetical protein